MTPTRLRQCINALYWTQRGLAALLRRPEGTVRQWARGTVKIPPEVAEWLEARAQHAEATPPPLRKNTQSAHISVDEYAQGEYKGGAAGE